jgi:hypothetical protein
MAAAVNLSFDNSVRRSTKHLPGYQTRDRIIHEILQILKQNQEKLFKNFMVQNDPLHSKDGQNYPYWKSVLPTDLEIPVMCSYMSRTSGHGNSYLRLSDFLSKRPLTEGQKFISRCETCHKVSIQTGVTQPKNLSRLPAKPCDLCIVNFYGSLHVGYFSFRRIFVRFGVLSKFVNLYRLKTTTTKACLNIFFFIFAEDVPLCYKTKRQQNSFWFQSNTAIYFYFYFYDMFRSFGHNQAIFKRCRIRCVKCK